VCEWVLNQHSQLLHVLLCGLFIQFVVAVMEAASIDANSLALCNDQEICYRLHIGHN
jgi:hypothetical protein